MCKISYTINKSDFEACHKYSGLFKHIKREQEE